MERLGFRAPMGSAKLGFQRRSRQSPPGGAEVNERRGPVDFKTSRGRDKTLVEMKLAKNTKLEQNLAKQAEIYQAASDAKYAIKAIIYFTPSELVRVRGILKRLGLEGHKEVVLIGRRQIRLRLPH
jgi:hypothetical protein